MKLISLLKESKDCSCSDNDNISMENTADLPVPENNSNQDDDNMARDLMVLIGKAIDEWANKYELNNVPKKILFKQALGIMNGWVRTLPKDND